MTDRPDTDDVKGGVTRRVIDYAQRHPVVAVFVVALTVRLAAGIVAQGPLASAFSGGDHTTYSRMAADAAEGMTAHWGAYQINLYRNTAAFMLPLTWIVALAGPSTMATAGFVAVLGALTAAGVVSIASRLVGASFALGAGLFVAMLPSQIAWSSLTLKDPMVWLLGVSTVVGFQLLGMRGCRAWWGAAFAVGSLMALAFTRLHSAVVIGWVLLLAVIFLRATWGWQHVLVAFLIAVTVPWTAGAGPGGLGLALDAPPPSELRQGFARGAASAIEEPADQAQELADGSLTTSPINELAHLPRGYSVMFMEPYPWHPRNDARFLLAKIDTLLWYPALFLALFGAYYSLRRSTPAVLVVAVVAGLSTALALYEGNLGTAFRHRGELVWGVAVLAAIGWREIRDRKATST